MANEISNGIWGISHNPVWGTLDSRKTESGGIDINSIAIALKPYFDLKSDIDHTHDSLYLKLSGGSLSGPISSQPGGGVSYIRGTAGQGAGLYVKKDTLDVNHYIPALVIQTKTGGGWALGNYSDDRLMFTYGSKENIDSETNSVSNYYLDTSGNFSGKAANVTGIVAVANGGTGADNAADARTNLGAAAANHNHDDAYVNVSGDTMTGVLNSTSYVQLYNTGVSIGVAPASDIYGRQYNFVDKDGEVLGQMRIIYRSSGLNQLHISAVNKNGDNRVANYLRLSVKNDGTRSVEVSDKAIWRDAIGAANVSHAHNDLYYTESEIDTKLSGKSDVSHNHDGAYVKVSGDTMTGNLSVPSGRLRLFPSDTTSLTYATAYFRNNNQFGICYYRPGNLTGANVYLLPTVDTIDGNKYYNILTSKTPVTIAQGGTGANNAADARTNLGAAAANHNHDDAYVNVSGDKMSGNLIIKKDIYDISASSISADTDSIFGVHDKNNRYLCYMRGRQETDGKVSIDIRARRFNNSANLDNYLRLFVAADGTRSVAVSDGAIWRTAIGAAAASHNHSADNITSGILPVERGGTGNTEGKAATAVKLAQNRRLLTYLGNAYNANSSLSSYNGQWDLSGNTAIPVYGTLGLGNGGTGGTDSGWKPLTCSRFSGTIYYRKIGVFLYFAFDTVKLASNLQTNSPVDLATIPDGYRPDKEMYFMVGLPNDSTRDKGGMITVTTGGVFKFQKAASISNWPTSVNIYCSGSYLVA